MIYRILAVLAVIAFIILGHKLELYIKADPARKYNFEVWCTVIMLGMTALIIGGMTICWIVGAI